MAMDSTLDGKKVDFLEVVLEGADPHSLSLCGEGVAPTCRAELLGVLQK